MIDYAGSSSGYHINPFSYSHNQGGYYESLTEVIVNEAAILYEKMVKDFTNQAITDVAADKVQMYYLSMIYTRNYCRNRSESRMRKVDV